tara:strand:- start:1058 stop:1402 length:345 start_codon:yes stop_codon:yes gene_type:complete
MTSWTPQIEEELTLLIKDWLKTKNRTQSDLKDSLNASSSRMPVLIEVIKNEYHRGGMPYVISKLSKIEKDWSTGKSVSGMIFKEPSKNIKAKEDPFSQLDLILKELKEKSENTI